MISNKGKTLLGVKGPITFHKYTITLYTPEHLQISWDVYAKKSADILSFASHSLLSLTETQEYVDEIYDEDYYMAPSIMDTYVPPRECNKIE